ncbi:MAG TPA: hypothetical protein ENK18_20655 [Deltaproteobacteria bacterium]|nr:hypothetical protein [Deltaproteobacteria bacterium]
MRLFFSLLLSIPACTPPCQQVCRKVLFDCQLDSERVALLECEQSCDRQETLYRQWQDDEKLALFMEHRRCLARSTCEEIRDGLCYDGFEDLFIFDLDKVLPPQSDPTPPPGETGAIEETGSDTGAAAR